MRDTTAADLHVGYILKQYPRLSETFILNEVLGLEQRGIDISVFSLRHATEGRFHPGVAAVRGPVHYLQNPDKTAFLDALRAVPDLDANRLPEVFAFIDRLDPDRRARLVLGALEIAKRCLDGGIDHHTADSRSLAHA